MSIWDKNLGANEATQFLRKLSNNVRTIIFGEEKFSNNVLVEKKFSNNVLIITFGEKEFGKGININKSIVETCISRFKHLRLLDLRTSTFKVLPSSIGTLKHLRYLNLERNTHIKKLPNSICDLQNLG